MVHFIAERTLSSANGDYISSRLKTYVQFPKLRKGSSNTEEKISFALDKLLNTLLTLEFYLASLLLIEYFSIFFFILQFLGILLYQLTLVTPEKSLSLEKEEGNFRFLNSSAFLFKELYFTCVELLYYHTNRKIKIIFHTNLN